LTSEYLQKSNPSDPEWEKMKALQGFAEGFLENPDNVMTSMAEKLVILLDEKKR